MPKFFIKDNQVKEDRIVIENEDVNHIKNVLRMKKEDELQVCVIPEGINYKVKIDSIDKNIICKIIEKIEKTTESNIDITIFQGIPKFEKMELIIQKNTEIGVKKIVPVMMERTVVKLNSKDMSKKIERWNKIAEIAAKQSGRDIIPEVSSIIKVNEIPEDEFDAVFVAYENEKENTLKNELLKLKDKKEKYNIAIVIGPEGGISENEITLLGEKKARFVSLGKRILRTETAGIVMASNILYELED